MRLLSQKPAPETLSFSSSSPSRRLSSIHKRLPGLVQHDAPETCNLYIAVSSLVAQSGDVHQVYACRCSVADNGVADVAACTQQGASSVLNKPSHGDNPVSANAFRMG